MEKQAMAANALEHLIGQRVKKRRQEMGFTLRELARRTDLTASFLSQVERGHSSLSLGSLRRIASALGLSMLQLLEENQKPVRVVRANSRSKLTPPGSHVSYELIVPDLSRKMELFIGRIEPGSGNIARAPLREPTEECIYVLSGALLVGLRGEEEYVLQTGDSVYFEGAELQVIANASETEETVWISSISPPVF